MGAQSLIASLQQEAARNLFRARNGIKYAAGISRPKLGLTPKYPVWRGGNATLYHYLSDRRTRRLPLLIVYSIIGRSYILDLRPGSSFIESLLDEGFDVYLMDFGVPDGADSTITLETYVNRYLPRAVRAVERDSGRDRIDLFGYCFGGILAVLLAASHREFAFNTLLTMATPIDFRKTEGLVQALQRGKLEVDDIADESGNIPAGAMYWMFRSLKPTSGISTYATLWERLPNDEFVEAFQAMSQWTTEQIPFPGACARQCVELLLRRNLLFSGVMPLGDRQVRLADIELPLLNVIAEHDHIVLPDSSRPLGELVSSDDVSELLVPAGHISLVASRQAVQTTIPGVVKWLNEHES